MILFGVSDCSSFIYRGTRFTSVYLLLTSHRDQTCIYLFSFRNILLKYTKYIQVYFQTWKNSLNIFVFPIFFFLRHENSSFLYVHSRSLIKRINIYIYIYSFNQTIVSHSFVSFHVFTKVVEIQHVCEIRYKIRENEINKNTSNAKINTCK